MIGQFPWPISTPVSISSIFLGWEHPLNDSNVDYLTLALEETRNRHNLQYISRYPGTSPITSPFPIFSFPLTKTLLTRANP